MIELNSLPALNAVLNGTSALLLCLGYFFIRRRRVKAHRNCMLGAFAVSSAFLASYLHYHYHHGATPFTKEGLIRTVYFSVLISHTVLAVVVVPLIFWTLYRAFRSQFAGHVRIARWTLPIWLYVSVTGVIVYGMLYH